MGPSSLCPQLEPCSTPPPPSFSSAHYIDHIFVFSFSIFRYPRVLRKAQAGGGTQNSVAVEASPEQWCGAMCGVAWAQEDKVALGLGNREVRPKGLWRGKHKGSFLCPGPVLVLVLGNKVSCWNLDGLRGWWWVGQKECSSGLQPEACSAWNSLVPGWTGSLD